MVRKQVTWGGLALALTLGAAVPPSRAESVPPPPPVEATAAITQDLPVILDSVGTMAADKEAPIRSVKSDRIVSVLVGDGQTVKRGDILFKLDDVVEQARVASAQSALAVATKALERTKELTKSGASARSQLPEAEAAVQRAAADLDAAQVDLSHTLVKAPFDGTLSLLKVEEGDYASPETELATLYAMPPLSVTFAIPQRHMFKLAPGQSVGLWTSAFPDHRHEGAVAVVNPAVDVETRAVKVKAAIPEAGKLRPGMFVSVAVTVDTIKGAVMVPEGALVPSAKGTLVFTVVDGKVKIVPVTTGERRDGLVHVVDGVAAGDMVITAGQERVLPDQTVTVQKAEAG
jgi:membrane fusion protein (multidrug efflux system)